MVEANARDVFKVKLDKHTVEERKLNNMVIVGV